MERNANCPRRGFWRRFGWGLIFAVLLTAFTGYALLDTFVIPREYGTAEAPTGGADGLTVTRQTEGAGGVSDGASDGSDGVADGSATAEETEQGSEGKVSVSLDEYRVNETTVYVARVSGGEIMTAFAEGKYGRNVKAPTSETAESVGAQIAVNGDFYGARNTGYVIRNGTIYRSTPSGAEDLVVWSDGSFGIISESEVSAEKLLAEGAQQVFSFGPALVVDGEVAVTEDEEVGRAMASNPRTAIAVTADGEYLLIVSDGRTSESEGLSLSELAAFTVEELGAVTAYNLDGGGSSTMYYNGEVVNNPTTGGSRIKERSVSDIVYFGY